MELQPKITENTDYNSLNDISRKLSNQSDRSYTSNTNYLLSGVPSNQEVSTQYATTTGVRKRVNFLLNKTTSHDNNPFSLPSSPEQQIAMRKVYRKTRKKIKSQIPLSLSENNNQIKRINNNTNIKNVVFNGTYPIDRPLKSRFVSRSNNNKNDSCSSLSELNEQEEEEILIQETVIQESKAIKSMSMQELVEDKNVKFNINKMRQEFHKSLAEFEKFLAKGAPNCRNVETFAIDEPL